MSCNGCRVLRKGCSESCILRPCLLWIEGAEAQGHATLFVAKFFGRTGLMNFISSVPESQRPGVFRSLLFEACGRTVNPVDGAVGLLGSGNWHVCQAAVEAVLRGETPLQPSPPSPEPPRRKAESADGGIGKARMLAASDVNLWLSPAYMRRPETPSEGSVTTCGGGGAEDAGGGSPQLLNLFS